MSEEGYSYESPERCAGVDRDGSAGVVDEEAQLEYLDQIGD